MVLEENALCIEIHKSSELIEHRVGNLFKWFRGGKFFFLCLQFFCNFEDCFKKQTAYNPQNPKQNNDACPRALRDTSNLQRAGRMTSSPAPFIPCKAIIASFHLYLQTLSGLCSCITFTITARVRRSLIHRTRQQPPSCSSCSFPCQLILSAPPRPQPLNLFPCCWQRGFSKT